MDELTNCPNCDENLRGGWKSNRLTTEKQTQYINFVFNKSQEIYCGKCSSNLLLEGPDIIYKERVKIFKYLELNISKIRIISAHFPYGWEYDSLSIVTGQSVTGTGFVSEFKSGFSDFFGGQSGSFNTKIAKGEQLCFSQLRSKALQLGANAIIGTDIDYGDVGEGKGMLLVCTAGTAIRIKNTEILGEDSEIIDKMIKYSKRLIDLDKTSDLLKAY